MILSHPQEEVDLVLTHYFEKPLNLMCMIDCYLFAKLCTSMLFLATHCNP